MYGDTEHLSIPFSFVDFCKLFEPGTDLPLDSAEADELSAGALGCLYLFARGAKCCTVLQELSGSDNMALVFDDNARVWEGWHDNLVPVPPYCYWDDEQYWQDEELNSSANVLCGYDERIAGGALMTAWDVTVSVLSNAILPPAPAGALSYIHRVNVRLALLEKRQQVSYLYCSTELCGSCTCVMLRARHVSCWTKAHSTSGMCTENRSPRIMQT